MFDSLVGSEGLPKNNRMLSRYLSLQGWSVWQQQPWTLSFRFPLYYCTPASCFAVMSERERERVRKKEWETHKKGERRRGCWWPKAALRPIHMQMAEGASTNPWEDKSYASSPSSPVPVPPPSPSLSEPFSDLAVSHSSLKRGPFE